MHAEAVAIESSENQLSEQERAHLRVPCDLHHASFIPLQKMLNQLDFCVGATWSEDCGGALSPPPSSPASTASFAASVCSVSASAGNGALATGLSRTTLKRALLPAGIFFFSFTGLYQSS